VARRQRGARLGFATEFDGIDDRRGYFLQGFSVRDVTSKLDSISKPTLIQIGSDSVKIS
jgi:hypothetical protein